MAAVGLLPSVRAALGYPKRIVEYRSLATASLIQRNLPNVAVPLRPEGKRIVCEGLGFSFDPERHPFYLRRMVVARDLVQGGHGTFRVDESGAPEFRSGNVRIVPQTLDDLIILDEVFLRRLYDLTPNREPFVLDIGMNVGLAALFYAGIKGWEVLAFEPFPETFAEAERNIERSGLADRIHTRNSGVAADTGTVEIAYNAEARATNGLFGNLNADRTEPDGRIEVRLVGATEALDEAIALAGDRPILAKIDCEGAEYEILDRWAETGGLDRIATLIVEYHLIRPEHDSKRLVDLFLAHGFIVQHLWGGPEAGGLFAIRAQI